MGFSGTKPTGRRAPFSVLITSSQCSLRAQSRWNSSNSCMSVTGRPPGVGYGHGFLRSPVECRYDRKRREQGAPDSRRQARSKRQVISGCICLHTILLKRSKIDISHDVKFLSARSSDDRGAYQTHEPSSRWALHSCCSSVWVPLPGTVENWVRVKLRPTS